MNHNAYKPNFWAYRTCNLQIFLKIFPSHCDTNKFAITMIFFIPMKQKGTSIQNGRILQLHNALRVFIDSSRLQKQHNNTSFPCAWSWRYISSQYSYRCSDQYPQYGTQHSKNCIKEKSSTMTTAGPVQSCNGVTCSHTCGSGTCSHSTEAGHSFKSPIHQSSTLWSGCWSGWYRFHKGPQCRS